MVYLWMGLGEAVMIGALILIFRIDWMLDRDEADTRKNKRDFEKQMQRLKDKEAELDWLLSNIKKQRI